MRESYELRIMPAYGERVLSLAIKERLPYRWLDRPGAIKIGYSILSITVPSSSPAIPFLTALDRQARLSGQGIAVAGFIIYRKYSEEELRSAPWLHFRFAKDIMWSGEECSTVYSDAEIPDQNPDSAEEVSEGTGHGVCPDKFCRWGARQVNRLALPRAKIPATRDVSCTWAGEWVVSDKAVSALGDFLFPFAHFSPILRCGARQARDGTFNPRDVIQGFQQLEIDATTFKIVPPTISRLHVIDSSPKGAGTLPCGHLYGPRLISELYVAPLAGEPLCPIQKTENGIGMRMGMFRAKAPLIVSQEFYRRWTDAGLKGAVFEVVHLV